MTPTTDHGNGQLSLVARLPETRQFEVDQLWEIALGDFPVFGDKGGRPEPLLVLRGVDGALCSFLRRTDDFVVNRVCFDGLHTSPYDRSDVGVGVFRASRPADDSRWRWPSPLESQSPDSRRPAPVIATPWTVAKGSMNSLSDPVTGGVDAGRI